MTYIACEDMDLLWNECDVKTVDEMWRKGASIIQIAEHVKRDTDEVAILVMDRAKHNRLDARPGGVYGGDNPAPRRRRRQQVYKQTEEELEALRERLTPETYLAEKAAGLNNNQIAHKYGMPHASVMYRLKKWNLV